MTAQRARSFLPAVICMAVIFWFSSQPGNEVALAARPLYERAPTIGKTVRIPWLKIGHMVGYGALGAALLYAFGPGSRRAVVSALAITLIYAITDEFHQTFTPGRSAGMNDVLIDMAAACLAILLYKIILQMKDSRSVSIF